MVVILLDTGELLICQRVVIIGVLIHLGQERIQKINVPSMIVIKGISFITRLVTKKYFRVEKVHNMAFPFLLKQCFVIIEIEVFFSILMTNYTFKGICP